MAKLVKTEREKRWEKILKEYDITSAENPGASKRSKYIAVGAKMGLSYITVGKVVERLRKEA